MQILWFSLNLVFVAVLITALFSHRAVGEAERRGEAQSRLHRLRRIRLGLGMLAGLLFVLMAVSFLADMRING
ncbi:hypothetical protein IDH44_18855 [Paenibacillus sp. IB182496]|uniref:Uncharacterized protein n=1 Tax=Paenibacillus sabuli TaxID=2772509 RepID=A0A927BXF3_9BACL|nr:hypothetical protein [Paenibacillus sabuli]MBD2847264.1 hypothetical protein [Paenibacillus sabuli]